METPLPFSEERLQELARRAGSTTDPEFHGLVFCVEPRAEGLAQPVWRIRFTIHGEAFIRTVGRWPDVTHAEARGRAELARRLLTEFMDVDGPFAKYTDGIRGPKIIRGLWRDYADSRKVPGETAERMKQHEDAFARAQRHIFPYIGDLTPNDVMPDDIARVLNSAYQRLSESTVTKIRQNIQGFFRWCRSRKYIDTSQPLPSDNELIKPLITKTSLRIRSLPHPALAEKDVGRFVKKLVEPTMIWKPGILAMLFTLLTAARVGNVVGSMNRSETQAMRWTDLSRDWKLWTIPADKMKTGNVGGKHVVPLSEEARGLLLLAQYWQEKAVKSEFVFTDEKGKKLRYPLMPTLLKKICREDAKGFRDTESDKDIHIHGFRATFKTWGTNHGVDSVLTEICLHHIIDKLRYDRAKAILRRRKVMQAWAEFCFAKTPVDWAIKAVQRLGNIGAGIRDRKCQKKAEPLLIGYERPLFLTYSRK